MLISPLEPIMGNCKSKEANTDTTNKAKKVNGNPGSQGCETTIMSSKSHVTGQARGGEHSSNEDMIVATRVELNDLLGRINEFRGTTESDKNYKYLDEMLTRCILRLDKLECNSTFDRSNRKEAVREINQALSILDRKLEINSNIKLLEKDLSET